MNLFCFAKVKKIAILYFFLQGVGSTVWWIGLFSLPEMRLFFMAPGAPESTLLAFAFPDILVYSVGSFACAFAIQQNKNWCILILGAHSGAAFYAAGYCLFLYLLSGGAIMGAIMMSPSLFLPAIFTIYFYQEANDAKNTRSRGITS